MSLQPHIDEIQGTEGWHNARLGKVTASRINDVLSWTKKGESVTRARYREELAKQRISGIATQIPVNHHMERGITLEPVARRNYELLTNTLVTEVGFYNHPTIAMSGASPDGVVGDDGIIEIKCPNEPNHLATIVNGEAPTRYFGQIQWQLACTQRLWCDFVSFSLDAPDGLQLYVTRVYRSEDWIHETEEKVVEFLAEVDELVKQKENQE
jgi:putative phage-type endonuclease